MTAGSRDPLPTIAILGLGEAGRIYGTALAEAGHHVVGFDPYSSGELAGVMRVDNQEVAVGKADVVLSLTAAAASRAAAEAAVDSLREHTVYADFTSSAPEAKRGLREVFAGRKDVRLCDVAILGPVVRHGPTTPLMAVGPAADPIARIMRGIGAPVEVVDGALGDAMAHKLLRSVFMKGLAATVTEAVRAGRAAGHEEWIRAQIAKELAGDAQRTIDRFLRGSVLHATRRADEMEAVTEYLERLGVEPTMSRAAAEHLRALAD